MDRIKGDYNEFWESRDYLNQMKPMKAALLMAHGFNDWNVMPEHSYRIYKKAMEMGSDIISVRQAREIGMKNIANRIPKGERLYVTIDIDAFCPSIAPGTGTPSHGGFLYYEVLEILQGLAKKHNIVGVDLVEVAPAYDPSESTQILAAQLLLNLIGFIFHYRQ